MAYDADPDDEFDEGYFAEVLDGADLTGLEAKFVKIPAMDATPVELAAMRVDDLILRYRQCRDQLATDRKGYKAREAKVKTFLSIISMTLRDKGDQLGVDNFKTDNGTAYRNTKETFRVANWDDIVAYLKETHNFQIIQKRVSPNAVKEIRETDGQIPPGIEPYVEVEFAVRSPTARKSK